MQISGPDQPTPHKSRGWIELNGTGTIGESAGVDYILSELSASYLIESTPRERLHLDFGVGIAYAQTKLDLPGENTTLKEFGPRLQTSAALDLSPILSAYFRIAVTPLPAFSGQDQEELGVSWKFNKTVAFNAGYRWWHYHNDNEDDAVTSVGTIDIYARGPVIGIMASL